MYMSCKNNNNVITFGFCLAISLVIYNFAFYFLMTVKTASFLVIIWQCGEYDACVFCLKNSFVSFFFMIMLRNDVHSFRSSSVCKSTT